MLLAYYPSPFTSSYHFIVLVTLSLPALAKITLQPPQSFSFQNDHCHTPITSYQQEFSATFNSKIITSNSTHYHTESPTTINHHPLLSTSTHFWLTNIYICFLFRIFSSSLISTIIQYKVL